MTKVFTLEELREFDGTGGSPIYVAFRGKVYDVSESELFEEGRALRALRRSGFDWSYGRSATRGGRARGLSHSRRTGGVVGRSVAGRADFLSPHAPGSELEVGSISYVSAVALLEPLAHIPLAVEISAICETRPPKPRPKGGFVVVFPSFTDH